MKKTMFLLSSVAALFLFSCDTAVSLGGGDGGNGGGTSGGSGSSDGGGSKKAYTLTVNMSPVSGAGSVSRSPNSASYESGAYVTVTASPASGYKFNYWTGASSSTGASVGVVMDADKTLTAVFEQKQAASSVIITLTYWSTTDTDAGGLDPTIYFVVSYGSNSQKTGNLLYLTDMSGQSWSGSSKSSAVYFSTSASVIYIEAVVKERDLLFDDDISPSDYSTFYLPVYRGDSGTKTLSGGKSTVRYTYEFQ